MIAYTESCPVRQGVFNGGIAQLARACGSYPQCPRFKSRCRYHFRLGRIAWCVPGRRNSMARWSSG